MPGPGPGAGEQPRPERGAVLPPHRPHHRLGRRRGVDTRDVHICYGSEHLDKYLDMLSIVNFWTEASYQRSFSSILIKLKVDSIGSNLCQPFIFDVVAVT